VSIGISKPSARGHESTAKSSIFARLVCWYNNDQFRLKLKPECWNYQDVGKTHLEYCMSATPYRPTWQA